MFNKQGEVGKRIGQIRFGEISYGDGFGIQSVDLGVSQVGSQEFSDLVYLFGEI